MRISVLNTYWADLSVGETDGAITYSSGRKLCGATTVGVTHNKTQSNVFESGASIYNKANVSGGTIDLSTHTMSEIDRASILYGITLAEGKVDYEVGADTDSPKRGAFGFAVQEEDVNTGKPKYRCNWYYDCTMAPPDSTYNTSDANGPNTEPDTFQFAFSRRPTDRKYRRTAVVDTEAEMTAFFQTVEKASA